ncbi:ankyrin repeat domain-containing protein [Bordetella sp. 15P40C-2]|uniref:ankyrin repeat domain-containing protein n=1 Tax=Bordetella sp. 15P40C-2 TaxID=2572246 RepID=UPI00132CA7EA|nr:ankyrin repeat domain-containing protein [Bordetella sp. 15P40C-2]MVW70545.1 hypothetical protein [Bordetella sp. 15P40C-2]
MRLIRQTPASTYPAPYASAVAPSSSSDGDDTESAFNALRDNDMSQFQRLLQQSDLDLRSVNGQGQTLLHVAAAMGNESAVRSLLALGADVEALDLHNKQSALVFAAESGDLPTVQALIEAYARPGQSDIERWKAINQHDNGKTAVSLALRAGHLGIVLTLVATGADPNMSYRPASYLINDFVEHATDNDLRALIALGVELNPGAHRKKRCPLKSAIKRGRADLVKTLCELGADFNRVVRDGPQMLEFAAQGGHVEMIKTLVRMGVSTRGGMCRAILCAAENSNPGVLEALQEAAVDIDEVNSKGYPPLALAIRSRRVFAVNALLAAGAKPDFRLPDGRNALMLAADADMCELARQFLNHCDIKDTDHAGNTVLMYAASARMVTAMISAGADPLAVNAHKATALMYAAQNNRPGVIEALLDRAPTPAEYIHRKDSRGYTALMHAADSDAASRAEQRSKWATLEILVQRGANIEARAVNVIADRPAGADEAAARYDGKTALMIAAENGHFAEVTFLLELGADVDAISNSGYTALMLSAANGHAGVSRRLCLAGARLDMENSDRDTALVLAARKGRLRMVGELQSMGADIDARNSLGDTPLLLLIKELLLLGREASFSDLMLEEILKDFCKNGADVNAADRKGNTALILAARYGERDLVNLLLCLGANVNHRNHWQYTALMHGAENGSIGIVASLLDARADPNISTSGGFNALMAAARNNHLNIVQRLWSAGALLNQHTSDRQTACDYATHAGAEEVEQWLLEHGAVYGEAWHYLPSVELSERHGL